MSLLDRLGPLAPLARRLHPEHRRFQRFLHSLPLDPDDLPDPLIPPSTRDVLVCGCPRTGTSLLAAMLHQPPAIASVVEPWDGMRMPPGELFASLRAELRDGTIRRGTIDYAALERDGAVVRIPEASVDARVEVRADHVLAVKWPVFWRYLDRLPDTKFIVCLRDPVQVIASFAKQRGALAEGLDYDTRFNRRMNATLRRATPDRALRRILLFDYVHTRLVPHLGRPNVFVVRYERWFTEPDVMLAELSTFLDVDLSRARPRIRDERRTPLPESERALIRRECRTAARLGYVVAP